MVQQGDGVEDALDDVQLAQRGEVANMAGKTLPDGADRTLDIYLLKPDLPAADGPVDDDSEIDNFQD